MCDSRLENLNAKQLNVILYAVAAIGGLSVLTAIAIAAYRFW